MNVSEKMEHFDVAIIGLGPAGRRWRGS